MKKNPFKGIAHTNGSSYNQRYFRHVEGARDGRPASRHMRPVLGADGRLRYTNTDFRDINPVPVSFCE